MKGIVLFLINTSGSISYVQRKKNQFLSVPKTIHKYQFHMVSSMKSTINLLRKKYVGNYLCDLGNAKMYLSAIENTTDKR